MTPAEEYLLHIAAGTDPATAFVATPRDEPEPSPEPKASGFRAAVILVLLVAGIAYLLFRL